MTNILKLNNNYFNKSNYSAKMKGGIHPFLPDLLKPEAFNKTSKPHLPTFYSANLI